LKKRKYTAKVIQKDPSLSIHSPLGKVIYFQLYAIKGMIKKISLIEIPRKISPGDN